MSDIVERLRAPAYWISGSSEGHEGDNSAPEEAADRIEKLEAALREIAKTTYGHEPCMTDKEAAEYFKSRFFGTQAIARAALAAPSGAMEERT